MTGGEEGALLGTTTLGLKGWCLEAFDSYVCRLKSPSNWRFGKREIWSKTPMSSCGRWLEKVGLWGK